MDSIDAPSRSRCRERRLKNVRLKMSAELTIVEISITVTHQAKSSIIVKLSIVGLHFVPLLHYIQCRILA